MPFHFCCIKKRSTNTFAFLANPAPAWCNRTKRLSAHCAQVRVRPTNFGALRRVRFVDGLPFANRIRVSLRVTWRECDGDVGISGDGDGDGECDGDGDGGW